MYKAQVGYKQVVIIAIFFLSDLCSSPLTSSAPKGHKSSSNALLSEVEGHEWNHFAQKLLYCGLSTPNFLQLNLKHPFYNSV